MNLVIIWILLVLQASSLVIREREYLSEPTIADVSSEIQKTKNLLARATSNAGYSACECPLTPKRTSRRHLTASRSPKQNQSINPAHLWSRTIEIPSSPQALHTYFINEMNPDVKNFEQLVTGGSDQLVDRGISRFREFGDEEFSFGLRGLCGCTSLFVWSNRGVYMSHWWEDLSFSDDLSRNRLTVKDFEFTQSVFEGTVLDPLMGGLSIKVGPGDEEYVEQVKLDKEKFVTGNVGYVKAIIIGPSDGTRTDPTDPSGSSLQADGYRPKWEEIRERVEFIFGDTPIDWQFKTYNPSRAGYDRITWTHLDPMVVNGQRGSVLFKYDPRHERLPGSGVYNKKAVLWLETQNVVPLLNRDWV